MVMESKTTSKTSILQALLLRAWRERWSDVQWGIYIKTVLPRGVSGDVYNLADCILQQALVGAGANQLVLSYLKHSLSAQLVSHAAVLQRLSKYSQYTKVHCVYSLLEFLEGILPAITCYGKPEETVLAIALLSTASWLLQVILNCHTKVQILEKASLLLQNLLSSDFYVAMMCLARYIDPELFAEVSKNCTEIESALSDKEAIIKSVRKLYDLDVDSLKITGASEVEPSSLVQSWLLIELIQHPDSSTTSLVKQLRLLQHLKNFSDSRIYFELMRASLLSLQDLSQTPYESQWGAFAFLKVPHVLAALNTKPESSEIVANAIELLLQNSPLLDAMDTRSSCSSLDCLLGELGKLRLLTDVQIQCLSARRKTPPQLKMDGAPTSAGIQKVIICAEPTLAGILKTLSTDYHKIQEALLGMLHQVLTGKSFELILAVATVQGQLRTFAARLIRFNECSKTGGDKARAQLFDISFLMLVAIVQQYGVETAFEPDGPGDSLVEQWVRECMVETNRPKSPDQLLKLCDSATVELLLQQFNAGESDFKGGSVKWQDILFNIPGVMREVLIAWEQGSLLAADVKRILDAVRGRMCCLPVAAAAWLCAYMRTAPQDTLLKPVNMVQQLLAPPPVPEEDSLRERWLLSCEIIRSMQRDIQLPLQSKISGGVVVKQPAAEQFHNLWIKAIKRGWLDHSSAKTVQGLLETAGPRWLVFSVVHELTQLRYRNQLNRGVDMALAFFHFNMYKCCLELLSYVLPQHLHNPKQADEIVDPQLSAIAKLTSYSLYATCELLGTNNKDVEGPSPQKIARLSETITDSKSDVSIDVLLTALRQLLVAFETTLQEGHVMQQIYFALHLLKNIVETYSTTTTTIILSAVPPALVSGLLKILPEDFSSAILLHLYAINTTTGRSNMAKDLCLLRNNQLKNLCSG